MTFPTDQKIYHIVHHDRLASIIDHEFIFCDNEAGNNLINGTSIGMNKIKKERQTKPLTSYPDLTVSDCVPFYYCPRSIMLFVISKRNNPEMTYTGGQQPIIHLEADLKTVIESLSSDSRWVFTLSNAGSIYFEDRSNIGNFNEINWDAMLRNDWGYSLTPPEIREGKQAEFLVEKKFPWNLFSKIGVYSPEYKNMVESILKETSHKPEVEVKKEWYY